MYRGDVQMANKMDEQIIVVSRKELFKNEQLAFQGVLNRPEEVQSISENVSSHYGVMRRGDAEENRAYKQPIPYVVIRRDNEIFTYKRLSGGGEVRLHDKLSIGAGGHMNDSEDIGSFEELILDNLDRELAEELDIKSSWRELKIVGLINDDINEVGKVHLGILAVLDLPSDAVVDVIEKDQLEGSWISTNNLLEQPTYGRLESWSQMAIDALCKK